MFSLAMTPELQVAVSKATWIRLVARVQTQGDAYSQVCATLIISQATVSRMLEKDIKLLCQRPGTLLLIACFHSKPHDCQPACLASLGLPSPTEKMPRAPMDAVLTVGFLQLQLLQGLSLGDPGLPSHTVSKPAFVPGPLSSRPLTKKHI